MLFPGVSLRAGHYENLPVCFDHLEELFLIIKEVQFKRFCPPVKNSCPCAEIVRETPINYRMVSQSSYPSNFPEKIKTTDSDWVKGKKCLPNFGTANTSFLTTMSI